MELLELLAVLLRLRLRLRRLRSPLSRALREGELRCRRSRLLGDSGICEDAKAHSRQTTFRVRLRRSHRQRLRRYRGLRCSRARSLCGRLRPSETPRTRLRGEGSHRAGSAGWASTGAASAGSFPPRRRRAQRGGRRLTQVKYRTGRTRHAIYERSTHSTDEEAAPRQKQRGGCVRLE